MAELAFRLLALGDFLTGASLTARIPALMWALYGLIGGAFLALWLEAPVYGLRKQRPLLVAAPLLLLAVAGAFQSSRQIVPSLAAPVAPPPPPIPAPNFAGGWDTGKWGAMDLVQDGDHVFGTYAYPGGVIEGTVTPEASGASTLRYRWKNQSGRSDGVGYFTLAPDARSFEGKWTAGENLNGGGQDWSGKRTAPASPPASFTGTWDTEWGQMHLNQGVTQVNGTYAYAGGLIEGNLQGKTLDFRWTNRVTGQTGTGQFTLGLYGNSLSGTWNTGNDPKAHGEAWTGKRLG